jgi:hypothetical protein
MQEVMLQILAKYILMLEFSSLLEKIIGNAALVCVPGDGEKKKTRDGKLCMPPDFANP